MIFSIFGINDDFSNFDKKNFFKARHSSRSKNMEKKKKEKKFIVIFVVVVVAFIVVFNMTVVENVFNNKFGYSSSIP